ncbi:MAG: hypothetical protein LQ342_008503 [Letrouitia transgressa]|nr:MAG: hypothetical protein LQ342_008503 [Letrouitia transgressa]
MSLTQAELDNIHVCFQRIPSVPKDSLVPPSNLIVPEENPSGPFQLAIGLDLFWKVGQTLRVSWWSGQQEPVSDGLKKKVKQYAKQWDALCNINLDFGNYGDDAEIRVAFKVKDEQGKLDTGSWSFVGKDCLEHSGHPGHPKKNEPTMNFGWLDDNTREDEIKRVVLHEFGHALGCVHEHQNPDNKIKWNERAVIDKYAGSPNYWSEATTRHNIINPAQTSLEKNSVFDPDSIMLYSFPAELTLNGQGTKQNNELSALDKATIRKLYPPQGHDIGFFDTKETPLAAGPAGSTQAAKLGLFNTKEVLFDPSYNSEPKMTIALSRIDLSCKANKSVAAKINQVTKDNAIVSVDTWDTSILNGGAASWIEANSEDQDWQFGEFNTQEQRDRNDTSSQTAEKVIYFDYAYSEPPNVVVALSLIDIENAHDYRVKTYATDITNDHFTIHIDTWGNSILYAAAASWVAFPADLTSALSFSFTTAAGNTKSKNSDRLDFSAYSTKTGRSRKFVKTPVVRTFLNLIDIPNGKDLRIKAYSDQVTEQGFTWHADTWGDTVLRQAGVSVVVWA